MIAQIAAIIAYIPVGLVSSRFGRKSMIRFGVCLLTACFAVGFFLTYGKHEITPLMYVVFALVGLVLAIHSIVKLCRREYAGADDPQQNDPKTNEEQTDEQ